MNREIRKRRFNKKETGYHKFAVMQLSEWIGGEVEKQFNIDGKIAFVPDVCKGNNLYEVVYSNGINGKKLGIIEYWCHRNSTEMTIFEVSADYILKQIDKPDVIETMECYIIEL